jgi:hypothetical protein
MERIHDLELKLVNYVPDLIEWSLKRRFCMDQFWIMQNKMQVKSISLNLFEWWSLVLKLEVMVLCKATAAKNFWGPW